MSMIRIAVASTPLTATLEEAVPASVTAAIRRPAAESSTRIANRRCRVASLAALMTNKLTARR